MSSEPDFGRCVPCGRLSGSRLPSELRRGPVPAAGQKEMLLLLLYENFYEDDTMLSHTTPKSKIYVDVLAEFTPDGRIIPLAILWEDGTKYRVDKVTDCCRAVSLKAGGAGIRYTCRICGGDHHLFYEENGRWFVEAKDEYIR